MKDLTLTAELIGRPSLIKELQQVYNQFKEAAAACKQMQTGSLFVDGCYSHA